MSNYAASVGWNKGKLSLRWFCKKKNQRVNDDKRVHYCERVKCPNLQLLKVFH